MLREWRLGKIGRAEVCDAHPELVRAARNLGEATDQECPICEKSNLRLVSYVYGDSLKAANGRCVTNQDELDRLGEDCDEFACYVVEVCTECNWNHLTRSYLLGAATPAEPAGGYASAVRWGYCVVQEMHHSSGFSSVLLTSPGRSGSM